LPLGDAHKPLAVSEQQSDPGSALAFTRAILAARRAHPALRDGTLTLLPGPALAFVRQQGEERIVCAFNLTDAAIAVTLPEPVQALGFGTGTARPSGRSLALGPHAAFFGIL
jgi:alpha-glucosidase